MKMIGHACAHGRKLAYKCASGVISMAKMRAMRSRFRMSRRDALRSGLATGAALTLRQRVWAATSAPAQLPLIMKAIPITGEKLPAVGLGTDQFRTSERDAIQAEIQRMQQM